MSYLASKKMNGEAEIRELAARICKDYLFGAWKFIRPENVCVQHISGGLSNLLYHISLPQTLLNDEKSQGEPREVLMRIYGQTHGHGERALESLITDSVIFTLLSERGLGPKLHGIFPGGRIEEYICARPLLTRELADPKLSTLIAHKMAMIHGMEVPLHKDPRWLWETIERWLKTCQKRLAGCVPDFVRPILEADLYREVQWLKKVLEGIGSPVVFCHNDMQEGNILLYVNDSENNNDEPRLVLIDFEYCSYNYRAFDIANHFMEWIYNYTRKEHPFFTENARDAATEDQKLRFIKAYLDEQGSREDPRKILHEVEYFGLASHFFWSLWSIVNAEVSQIPFGYWEYGLARFNNYLRLKRELVTKYQANRSVPVKRKVDAME